MSGYTQKIALKSTTALSINDRFTFLQRNIPEEPIVQRIHQANSIQQQASILNRQLARTNAIHHQASILNRQLARNMETRPSVMAALKIKRKSLRQRLGQQNYMDNISVKDRLTLPTANRGSIRGGRGRGRGRGFRGRGNLSDMGDLRTNMFGQDYRSIRRQLLDRSIAQLNFRHGRGRASVAGRGFQNQDYRTLRGGGIASGQIRGRAIRGQLGMQALCGLLRNQAFRGLTRNQTSGGQLRGHFLRGQLRIQALRRQLRGQTLKVQLRGSVRGQSMRGQSVRGQSVRGQSRRGVPQRGMSQQSRLLMVRGRGGVKSVRGAPVKSRGGRGQIRGSPVTRGRGGFRGGRGHPQQKSMTKEELDSQLDQYMSGTRSALDRELDNYKTEA